MKAKVYVKRQDSFEFYEVECYRGMTILALLNYIKENIDETLAFRHFCRAGICGTCAIKVNGFPKLACKEQVDSYVLFGRDIVLEPLDKHEIIKDLVVNHEGIVEKGKKYRTWLEPKNSNIPVEKGLNEEIEKSADCILCLACQSYCPQVLEEKYAGPLYFAKMYRYLVDPRENNGKRYEEALEEGFIYHCLSCNKCNHVCPKEVEPATLIRKIMIYKKEHNLTEVG